VITSSMTTPSKHSSDVAVEVMGFAELCRQVYALKLDHYQRPYVWGRKKVEQLLADLAEFCLLEQEEHYYLGTLLLHRDDGRQAHFVIDGQQRLSSLAVLFHALHGALPHGIEFHYRSPLSVENLRHAQGAIGDAKLQFDAEIFSRLRFTVITVAREDLAFTFFDTQNNRGVPLKPTDLLKAYHLRAINGSDSEQVERLQRHCASRWEAVQVSGPQEDVRRRDFAPELFHHYLWRARNWRGQKHIEREEQEAILVTFQDQSVRAEEIDSVPLYPGHGNQFATRLCLPRENDYRLDIKSVHVSAGAASLPFSLRQPIHQGVGFFLYTQKYAALLDEVLHRPVTDEEVERFRVFYRRVVKSNSHYLRELFNLAVLMYVDRFGYQHLLEFARRAELVLGGLRLAKQYIFKEAPLKYLREADHNLLDIIAGAYRPQEVMEFLQRELARSEGYDARRIDGIRKSEGQGVQGRYLKAVCDYYRETAVPLSNASTWLDALGLNDK